MPAVHIATAGVAVGLAVMILSVCLVKGFQGEVAAKLAGKNFQLSFYFLCIFYIIC